MGELTQEQPVLASEFDFSSMGLWRNLCGTPPWELCKATAARKPRFDGWPRDQSLAGQRMEAKLNGTQRWPTVRMRCPSSQTLVPLTHVSSNTSHVIPTPQPNVHATTKQVTHRALADHGAAAVQAGADVHP
jgi:hypothetical protein